MSTRQEPLEILFRDAACAAPVGDIAVFIYRHFAGNLGGPLVPLTIGLVLLGLGAAAVRVDAQYIARNPC